MGQPNKKQIDSQFHKAQNNHLFRVLENLESRSLFYPCSGQDFIEPIENFLPFIDEFWFVDTTYDLSQPLVREGFLKHLGTDQVQESGLTFRRKTPFKVQIRTDTYFEESTSREIKIHSCQGKGYNTFRVAFRNTGKQLSIFFHRGDSIGEGGSDFRWLGTKMLKYLLLHLEPNGLIVTDGSLACDLFKGTNTPFRKMRRYFEPIANLEPRYGPTVVWKTSN
ncbi:hypothetical protein N9B22_00310 [bacterium]|nr:hypothetical protein [bacterium]